MTNVGNMRWKRKKDMELSLPLEYQSVLTGGSASPQGGENWPLRKTEADRGGFCAEGKREKPPIISTKGKEIPSFLKPPEQGSEAFHTLLSLLIWNTKAPHERDSEGELKWAAKKKKT